LGDTPLHSLDRGRIRDSAQRPRRRA
jgi:hypothetical protein